MFPWSDLTYGWRPLHRTLKDEECWTSRSTRLVLDAIENDLMVEDDGTAITVFLLEVQAIAISETNSPIRGLVLRQVQGSDECFRRIGYFEITETDPCNQLDGESKEEWWKRNLERLNWFDECEQEVFTIV